MIHSILREYSWQRKGKEGDKETNPNFLGLTTTNIVVHAGRIRLHFIYHSVDINMQFVWKAQLQTRVTALKVLAQENVCLG